MAVPELKVELRDEAGKGPARKLRAKGLVPGVLYGVGAQTTSLSVDPLALRKLILQERGRNFLVNLKIKKKTERAMLKDYQINPVSRRLLHVDFMRVKADQAVTLEVAVEFKGEPAGLSEGGVLEVRSQFVSLTGLPDKLPQVIEVDIGHLGVGDTLKVSDLDLAQDLITETHPETALCAVVTPVMFEEEVEAAEEEAEGEAGEEGEAKEAAPEESGEEA